MNHEWSFCLADLITNQIVAIKKIKLGVLSSDSIRGADEGVSFSAIREVKSLQEIKHNNILNLLDVFVNKKNINLVFEFCGLGDLEQVIKESSIILQESDIKQYMKMILEAVDHCHSHWVLHRDLKPSNLLLWKNEQTNEVELKLADFVGVILNFSGFIYKLSAYFKHFQKFKFGFNQPFIISKLNFTNYHIT